MDEVEIALTKLELLTEEIVACLRNADVSSLLVLMSRQCALMEQLAKQQVDSEHHERLRHIADLVGLQQRLIEQGLHLSTAFLNRLYQYVRFSEWA